MKHQMNRRRVDGSIACISERQNKYYSPTASIRVETPSTDTSGGGQVNSPAEGVHSPAEGV
eukprot:5936418-Pyramimonas_sp.AAC.2